MKFFPSENIIYKTKLPEAEVVKRLSKNIEPVANDWGRIFAGSISRNEFEMRRNINYGNSYQPRVTGNVSTLNGETVVKVKMELIGFIRGFMMFLCSFACLMFLLIVAATIASWHFVPFILFPPGFIFFMWLLAKLSFQFEADRVKKNWKK